MNFFTKYSSIIGIKNYYGARVEINNSEFTNISQCGAIISNLDTQPSFSDEK